MSQTIPPLRQSTYETMSCPHSYGVIHIQGLKSPDSLASTRGTEIHSVLANYVTHCAKRRVPADYLYLDALVSSVGDESAEILETCREGFTVDWENFYDAEITLALDAHFGVCPVSGLDRSPESMWGAYGRDSREWSMEPAAYSGTLDAIYLMPGGKVARIEDYKSHPRPFEPTTFQAKLYSLFLFMHMPELTEIEFVLRFVRYPNVSKPIKFLRNDVPNLMEDVKRVRSRQQDYHRAPGAPMAALPGTHCAYCPASTDHSCPVDLVNPMLNISPEDRVRWKLEHDAQNRANNQSLQQWVDGTGKSITVQDANGKSYTFGPKTKESIEYPLFTEDGAGGMTMSIVDELLDHQMQNPEDLIPRKGSKPWFLNLRIGATKLKGYLKANKRADLQHKIEDNFAIKTTKIVLGILRDAEVDDGKGEEYREFNEEIEF